MNWLNYHHLYYFLKIAELGSVSKAAEVLKIGQPALSTQLKELEDRLGLLFDRRNRGLHLNERGRVVLKYAKDIFGRGNELLSVLERGELSTEREVMIGAQEGVPKAIIADVLLRLHKTYGATFKVIEGDPSLLIEELLHGRIDFVIFDQELSHSSGTIFYLPLGKEKLAIWGATKFKSLSKNFPLSIDNVPFVTTPIGHPLRQDVERFFLTNEIHFKIQVEAPDTALVKELTSLGLGLAALGEATVKAWTSAGKMHKIGDLPFTQNYWMGIPKRSLKDPLAEALKKEFGKKK